MSAKKYITPLMMVLIVGAFFLGMLSQGILFPVSNSVSKETAQIQKTSSSPPSYPDFTPLIDQVKVSVVTIKTTKKVKGAGQFRFFGSPFGKEDPFRDFFERFFGDQIPKEFEQKGFGSGFIIDKDGFILTNYHVVAEADEIVVKLSDKTEFEAHIIGLDQSTDLGLIKIDSKKPLPVAILGDSDKLKIGEWVLAVGNPFGLEHTVTAGIISAKGRVIGQGPYDNFLQTDASINPGNSGGPLFNMKGEVVGINTAIVGLGTGIGFAIPINMAKELIPQLKAKGKVMRGWLGVTIQPWQPGMAKKFGLEKERGALVGDVIEGEPAEKAGIRPGDIIVEVDGEKIEDSRDLLNTIAKKKPGSKVSIKVLRAGKEMNFQVTVGERPAEIQAKALDKTTDEKLGLTVQDITPEIAERFGLSDTRGVIVSEIRPGSPAQKSGLRRGDIIREVEKKKVENVQEFKEAIKNQDKESILLWIQRGRNNQYLVMKLK
jgi:serine protease Do